MTGQKKALIWSVRLLIMLAASAFIIAGISRSEHLEIMNKAIKICLECIGIG